MTVGLSVCLYVRTYIQKLYNQFTKAGVQFTKSGLPLSRCRLASGLRAAAELEIGASVAPATAMARASTVACASAMWAMRGSCDAMPETGACVGTTPDAMPELGACFATKNATLRCTELLPSSSAQMLLALALPAERWWGVPRCSLAALKSLAGLLGI